MQMSEKQHTHEHSHGLVDSSIVRSRAGVKAVSLSFLVLLLTAVFQAIVYLSGHSVALLSDLIHNFGDALTAVPLGLAFFFRSKKGERLAGYFVVLLILVSACVALYEVMQRFLHPQTLTHLWAILIAGLIGFLGNELAGVIRTRAGKRLDSPALIADGNHAHIDGLVSLGVVISTIFVALGFKAADPLVGLFITLLILRISWQSWVTIRSS
jgi:cation diffusion facilitator family transporter